MHRTHSLSRAAAVMAIAGLWLMSASPALAADTLDPPVVTATLEAGESMTVEKTLHLDGLPTAADIIVAIDTTGSMGSALAKAKTDATQICLDVQAEIPGARFAAVEFQDYPISPYGGATDSPYELHTAGYTSDCAAFSAGVAAMTLGFGADGPESNNRVHFEAYSDAVLLASREPDASRFLVVLADNVPHSVASFGACPSTAPFSDPGRNGTNESGAGDDIETPAAIDGLNLDEQVLLYISYNSGASAHPCHRDLAIATGGEAVPDSEADDIGAFIIAQAEQREYTVDLEVSAGCEIGFSFDPAPPYGPFTGEQTIEFTETITAPAVEGDYTCTITAVMSPGGPTSAVETVNVTVLPTGPPASTPGCKVTYGGWIVAANGDRASFGGNAHADGLKGQQQYNDHGPAVVMNVHSIDVLAVVCSSDGTEASIYGTATVDGEGSFDYQIDLTDQAAGDTYRIRLSNGYDSGEQPLMGGNVKIHLQPVSGGNVTIQ